jgi:hypothetical protein
MLETKCGFDDHPDGLFKGCNALVVHGPTLSVQIGFDPNYNAQNPGKPNLQGVGYRALVDTGAGESCIDGGLAMQLNLPIINRQKISGVGGVHEVNVHLAQIYVPTLDFTIHGRFCAADLIAGGQPHSALIGRTFLRAFRMTYEGDTGSVIISRAPVAGA